VSAFGTANVEGVDNVWRVDYDLSGSAENGYALSDAEIPKRGHSMRFSHNFITGTTRYYITGVGEFAGQSNLFYLQLPATGASVAGARVSGADFDSASLDISGGSDHLVSGIIDAGQPLGYIARFESASGLLKGVEFLTATGPTKLFGARSRHAGLLTWGTSRDSTTGLEPFELPSQAYSASWVPLTGSGGDPGWTVLNAVGNTADLTGSTEFDADPGGDDMLVMYAPLPEPQS
jgi:hypothetical protein